MSNYAQKDYQTTLGKSELTIAQGGSLLTAFANLLSRFDVSVTPDSLNNIFDDFDIDASKLTWSNISAIHPNVGIFAIGNGAPQYSDSIVVFNHNDRISYAVVADAQAGTIIDSFDGEEKDWDLYGGPTVFATFVKYPPLEVTPLAFSAPVTESPVSDTTTETSIATDTPEAEVFDLTKDEEIDTTTGIYEAEAIPVHTKTNTPGLWKQSLKSGLGVIETVAKQDAIITDLDGELPDVELKAGTLVNVAGRFVKDGVTYYRTDGSTKNDHWYGIPSGVLSKSDKQNEDELDNLIDEISKENQEELSTRDKIIKGAATAEGKVLGMFRRKKNKIKEIE